MVSSIETRTKRVIVARMFPGEDVLETIESVAKKHGVESGQLSLIGAIAGANLGYFDLENKQYKHFSVEEDVEVVSCMGNISMHKGDLVVHAHMIVADDKGNCHGGHLLPGCKVSVTIELIITETEATLKREKDEKTGLNLLTVD
ncbi:DNA-binding protein [Candidatus Thorarchaeota archaeon]|nr:MAG: DNA-binding protein [Candidatus Thorarchaeota archaeon]